MKKSSGDSVISGIGIDIVKSERIESLYKAHGKSFLEKILSGEEIALMPAKFPVQYIGGRFAVKEAIVKALGGRPFAFSEITVLNNEAGRPFVKDTGCIAKLTGRSVSSFVVHISISHEKDYCTASALIEFL